MKANKCAGKTEQLHVKNEIRTFSNNIYKNKLKGLPWWRSG